MKGSIGVNLGHCSFYEPTGLLYADAMRSAQNFYGGSDPVGNPTIPGQKPIIWQNLSPAAGAGVYQCIGTGKFSLALGPTTVNGVTISSPVYDATKNQTTCTVMVPAPTAANPWPSTSQLSLQFNWQPGEAPPTNIQLWRPGATVGDLFYKPFLTMLAPFSTLRFMDTLATNGSTLADWSKRPLPTWRNYQAGISWEDALALCVQTKKDGYFCVPYLVATAPGGLDAVAAWLAGNIPAGSAQRFYIEISNELGWNSAFPQWRQNQTAAAANAALKYTLPNGAQPMGGNTDPNILGWRQVAWLTVQLSMAVMKAYGVDDWRKTPIRPVINFQWGSASVAQYELQYISDVFGWPGKYIYMGVEAPYVTEDWTKNPQTAADLDADLLTNNPDSPSSQQNAALAAQFGIKFGAYEFGKDMGQNPANASIRDQAQSVPAAGTTEYAALSAWAQVGGGLLCYYQVAYIDQNSGDWGLTQDVFNLNTPRYQAVAQAAQLMWWDDSPLPLPVAASPAPAPVQTPPLFSGSFSDSAGKKLTITVSQ